MPDIRIQNLSKHWGTVRAVDDISFQVKGGSLTVLLGPSGCGKSTLLRLIAGLEAGTAGRIHIGEQEITHLDPSRRGVSMVFQSYALFPHLNVRENILFGLKVRKVDLKEQNTRLQEAARMVGLEGLLHRKSAQLSGGQRQRVALARSIVSRRPVCLMDEPLSNLDAKLRTEMRDEIRGLQQKLGLTMVYVTHDQVEAMTMADQVVLLNEGRMVQMGPPESLYEHPDTLFCARFMGSPPMNLLRIDAIQDPKTLAEIGCDSTGADTIPGGFIGVRPEKVQIGDRGLPVTVAAVDYLGSETVLRLRHGRQVLFARMPGGAAVAPGESLQVSWPAEAVHRFNEDGVRRESD